MKRFLSLLLVALMLCVMAAPAMADDGYEDANLAAFVDLMDSKGYTYDMGDGYLKAEFNIDSSLEECDVWVWPYSNGIKVQADVPFTVDSRDMDELAQWAIMMNNSLRVGEFYLSYENGFFGYEVFCLDYDGVPSQGTMNYALVLAVTMLEKYSDGIVAITESNYTAEEAYELFFE